MSAKLKKEVSNLLRNVKGKYENYEITSWSNADPKNIAWLVQVITEKGGAVRFGMSRDEHAYSIGLYYGDERETFYIRPNQNLDDNLRNIAEYLQDLPHAENGYGPSR